jgi:small subunit ribosomal protein S21
LGTQARRHQRKATSRREALFDIRCQVASHRQTCPRAPLGSTFIANLSDPIQSSLRTRMSRSPGRPRQPQQREPPVQVFVRDNNVDQALRVLKRKMQRGGVFKEMRRARFYEKPSEQTARSVPRRGRVQRHQRSPRPSSARKNCTTAASSSSRVNGCAAPTNSTIPICLAKSR